MVIDFEGLAARLLEQSEVLVPRWLPAGKRRGHEWVCGDLRGEPGESTSVNLSTGAWADFATDVRGGDLISLYAAIHGLSQLEAARELSPEQPAPRLNGHASAASPRPPESAPEDAPADASLPSLAEMTGRWTYRRSADAGPCLGVCRIETPDGKSFRQFTWRDGKWTARGFGDSRPLYRLPELLAAPDRPVLIVEGEKPADAAAAALGDDWGVTTWAGGAQAARKSDWSALKRRTVTIWPDADDAGRKAAADIAAILIGLHAEVSIVPTDAFADKFDAADADAADVHVILASAKPIQRPTRETRSNPAKPTGATVEQNGRVLSDGSAFVQWQALGLDCSSNGQPYPTLGNAAIIVQRHPELTGKIWLDTFRGRVYHALHGAPEPWTDAEGLRLTAWINQTLRLPKVGLETVYRAVELTAANNPRNSVTEWLESLIWDGVERLANWLSDCLGVVRTPFTIAVARNWLVSMVARAYQPGCQADHMPVLEGNSGAGKSSSLAILGGEWYRAAPQAFGSKEFVEAIQGAWLVEIPDMVGFGRREHTQIISAITTRSDVYRASYGRTAQEHPRTAIFAATSETDEYLQDSRGKRRYWPLRCTEINRDALAGMREQLFAEAVTAFKTGATWHEVPAEEARAEQSQREEADIWIEKVSEYTSSRTAVSVSEVANDALHLDYARQDRSTQMRISKCLKELGFSMKVERLGTKIVRMYRRAS